MRNRILRCAYPASTREDRFPVIATVSVYSYCNLANQPWQLLEPSIAHCQLREQRFDRRDWCRLFTSVPRWLFGTPRVTLRQAVNLETSPASNPASAALILAASISHCTPLSCSPRALPPGPNRRQFGVDTAARNFCRAAAGTSSDPSCRFALGLLPALASHPLPLSLSLLAISFAVSWLPASAPSPIRLLVKGAAETSGLFGPKQQTVSDRWWCRVLTVSSYSRRRVFIKFINSPELLWMEIAFSSPASSTSGGHPLRTSDRRAVDQ